jgi:ferredoxin
MSIKVRLIVESDGREIEVDAEAGETLVQVAYRAGVTIQQTCGGVPSCTDCKCIVKDGIDTGFEPAQGPELRLMGNVYFITHERLACQALVKGNSVVFVPTPRRPTRDKSWQSLRSGERRHGKEEKSQKESRSKEKGHTQKEGEKNGQEKVFHKKEDHQESFRKKRRR